MFYRVLLVFFFIFAVAEQSLFNVAFSSDYTVEGGTVTVFVRSDKALNSVNIMGFSSSFKAYQVWCKDYKYLYRAFVGIPVSSKQGKYAITISAKDIKGNVYNQKKILQVSKANFPFQYISLPSKKKKLLSSPQLSKESKQIRKIFKQPLDQVFFVDHFIWPAKGKISSPFGAHRKYNDGRTFSYHKGIDIAANVGEPVVASNHGKVVLAENYYSHGKTIIIEHGHAVKTIYTHLNMIKVKKGSYVKRGSLIGAMGQTGIATGSHLHFGLSIGDVRVNPIPWLEKKVQFYCQK